VVPVATTSDVVIHVELVRVRAQGDLLRFAVPLVVDPGVDDILGEDAALQQELVVRLQGIPLGPILDRQPWYAFEIATVPRH
jgi:hypothetical protein